MGMKYDCLAVGTVRMDAYVKLPEKEVDEICSIDRKKCVIQMGFGEKIPVTKIEFAIGGNAGNNAVGLTRLGLMPAIVGTVGDGWTDKRALEELKKEKVETKYLEVVPGQTGFGVVINYQEERTILSYYSQTKCNFPGDPNLAANWIYLTSMGEGYEEFYQKAVEWAERTGAKIAFNPGTRQIKAGLEKLRYVYAKTEVLFVNREESGEILGMDIGDIRKLLEGLKSLGVKTAVITDGPAGTYAYDGQKYLHMPIVDAPVVERTGAGDAFGSGFLAAVISGKTLEEALKWGTVNSASVLGFVGPVAGLLTPAGMDGWLTKAGSVKVEEL